MDRNAFAYGQLPGVLFVGQDGSATNPGSAAKPLDSLNSALARARYLRGLDPGIELAIELQAGTHYLDHPVLIGPEDSGPLVIRGPGSDQTAVLSGGRRLDPDWQEQEHGVWSTPVEGEPFDQVFLNGEKLVRARYPNYDSSVTVFNGYTNEADIAARARGWVSPAGGFIHGLHGARWGDFHYRIVGKERDGSLMLEGGWQNNRPRRGMHSDYRFADNIREELDHPGEWFYDPSESRLYLLPPPGVSLVQAKVEVSGLSELIIIRGDSDKPVRQVRIENLVFRHAAQTFMETAEPLLRSDWAIYRGGALLIEGAEQVQVVGNDFVDLGGNGVFVSAYARDVEVRGNHFRNIDASAIAFVGRPDAVRSPSFQYFDAVDFNELDLQPGPQSPDYPARCTAENNLIHDIGRLEKQTTGVQISMASEITVRSNSIYNVPRAGINISEGTWGGHLLEYNDVFNTVLETEDHGAFNSWGRDRFWHPRRGKMDRIVEENPALYLLDALKTTVIRNNRFQTAHGWDIDLDDGSSNYHIYNNLCLQGGLKLREGFGRVVENNILINNGFHPHVWFEESGDVFRRNVVMRPHADIRLQGWGEEVDGNIFSSASALQLAQSHGVEQHGRVAQLGFIDPAAGNYRLSGDNEVFEAGFENFPMDRFGVTLPRLKALAEQPVFPVPETGTEPGSGETINWRGLVLKNIETLGERSAAGLDEASGVRVVSMAPDAPGVFREGDVIIGIELGETLVKIQTTEDLESVIETGPVLVTVMRNQREQVLETP